MKKTFAAVAVALTLSQSLMALKPVETEGFDLYRNSFKVDLVSIGYVAPQIEWEHYTDSRFTFGIYAQAHFVNRSSFVTSHRTPSTVVLDGTTYNVSWKDHPLEWYGDIKKNDETYRVKWDRKYVGVMICPETRFYTGRKPARGFYVAARIDMGVFREMFDVSVETLSQEYRKSLTDEQKKTDEKYQDFIKNSWHKGGTEKGELDFGLGLGGGLGYQWWFGKNSHWGLDANLFVKSDWKIGQNQTDNWEFTLGPGSPFDFNVAFAYRF